ncbi:MAG: hypothetical protein KME26_21340 [Oscillatoria princeps RMCB-10]|jgi:hypothetical protein|nr:hypothetical protein [Oscillatoria princeps RMCB-10]
MSTSKCLASTCRNCRFYSLEGRRGGHCLQLNVQVQASWKACALAVPPFAPPWEGLQQMIAWEKETPVEPAVRI